MAEPIIALLPGAAGGKIAGKLLKQFDLGELLAIVGAIPPGIRS
jgi:hypothetical protein